MRPAHRRDYRFREPVADHRHRKRAPRHPPGLAIIERDGHWHIHGTLRVRGRPKRVRRSTGLPARPDTKETALAIKRRIETEFADEVVYGIKPSVALGVAARRYLVCRF
jgi:hypothetical protein